MSLARFGGSSLDEQARTAVTRLAHRRARDGIIIMLQSNLGFLPFLRNVICSMARLHVYNFLVVALDNATCAGLGSSALTAAREASHACVYPHAHQTSHSISGTSQRVASYGSRPFIRMVLQKPIWIQWFVAQGLSVVQCDLDIVWLQNPLPLLKQLLAPKTPPWASARAHPIVQMPPEAPSMTRVDRKIFWAPNDPHRWPPAALHVPDIIFQGEQAHGLNSGFFLVRPTAASNEFLAAWLDRLEAQASNGTRGIDEQHAFNSALIRLKVKGSNITYGVLEDDQFPNGKIWWQYPMWADKRAAFIVHANWNKREKKARLMRDRLWFLKDDDAHCSLDFDPHAGGCSKLCSPVWKAAPGNANHTFKDCSSLNREDDRRARRHGARWARNGSWDDLRGLYWHPRAYAEVPKCTRNTSVVMPFAAMIHKKLLDEVHRREVREQRLQLQHSNAAIR